MQNTVIITAQYYENYNVGPEGFNQYGDKQPSWKPKGAHQFMIELDTDILLYCDNVAEVFNKMLEKHNTVAERFEYIEHDIQWRSPSLLGTEDDFLEVMRATEVAQ